MFNTIQFVVDVPDLQFTWVQESVPYAVASGPYVERTVTRALTQRYRVTVLTLDPLS